MLEYWFMFPVGIVIATIAMMSGIGGALMFSLIFLLRLEPRAALATGLFIEIAGFGSGLIGYVRRGLVNYDVVRALLPFVIPVTFLGVIVGRLLPAVAVKLILALLLGYLAYQFLAGAKTCEPKHPSFEKAQPAKMRCTVDPSTKALTGSGALLVGMISSGLGAINEYSFLCRLTLRGAFASGRSVFLVALACSSSWL